MEKKPSAWKLPELPKVEGRIDFSSGILNLWVDQANDDNRKRILDAISYDPWGAEAIDDALSIEKTENGYRVFYSYADVANVFDRDSKFMGELLTRFASIYGVEGRYSLLPKRVLDDIGLSRKSRKNVISFVFEFDNDFRLIGNGVSDVCLGHIKVEKNLNRKNFESDFPSEKFSELLKMGELMTDDVRGEFSKDPRASKLERFQIHLQRLIDRFLFELQSDKGAKFLTRSTQIGVDFPLLSQKGKIVSSESANRRIHRYGIDSSRMKPFMLREQIKGAAMNSLLVHARKPLRDVSSLINQQILTIFIKGKESEYDDELLDLISAWLNERLIRFEAIERDHAFAKMEGFYNGESKVSLNCNAIRSSKVLEVRSEMGLKPIELEGFMTDVLSVMLNLRNILNAIDSNDEVLVLRYLKAFQLIGFRGFDKVGIVLNEDSLKKLSQNRDDLISMLKHLKATALQLASLNDRLPRSQYLQVIKCLSYIAQIEID